MGILNITPDSFSDGGDYSNFSAALAQALRLIEDGADIIDIGGESTRPGAAAVDTETELNRVVPIVEALKKEKPECKISVDTTKLEVAAAAAAAGADIINDVSGLDFDVRLADTAAEYNLGLVLMHMKGTPGNMQNNPTYDNVVEDVFEALAEKIRTAKSRGVKKIIADVGIGFGKTLEHNRILLKNHERFEALGVPLLLGISRKSFIGNYFGISDPKQRDIETALLHTLLLNKRIDIIRVHNVALLARVKQAAAFLRTE